MRKEEGWILAPLAVTAASLAYLCRCPSVCLSVSPSLYCCCFYGRLFPRTKKYCTTPHAGWLVLFLTFLFPMASGEYFFSFIKVTWRVWTCDGVCTRPCVCVCVSDGEGCWWWWYCTVCQTKRVYLSHTHYFLPSSFLPLVIP